MSTTPTDAFGDGFSDGLTPVSAVDVAQHGSVSDLLREMAHTAFGGRNLGEGADTLEAMIRDPACFVVMTLSGAMTVAKQGLLICEMIERGWVQAIVSTGALMAHGLVEGAGLTHFKYDPRMSDEDLLARGYDRVYDTLELESNLDEVDHLVRAVLEKLPEGEPTCSEQILHQIGKHLHETTPPEHRAVLKSAYVHQVPIFVPAFTDSEMGLDFELANQIRLQQGHARRLFEPFLDLDGFARLVGVQRRCGIFTIGGGVPRNWAQQVGPFLDLLERRTGRPGRGFRYHYGVRVCPEPAHWGGLSGCTYSEGVSWGKFAPESEGGRFSEILADATLVWPFLVRGLIERLGDGRTAKQLVARPPADRPLLALR